MSTINHPRGGRSLKFSDGVEFDVGGKLRIEKRHDGLYVVGNGMCCPVGSAEEADELIEQLGGGSFSSIDKMSPVGKAKPTCRLTGVDGNVFAILGVVKRTLKEAGYTKDDVNKFLDDASSGDYDHALLVVMDWVEVGVMARKQVNHAEMALLEELNRGAKRMRDVVQLLVDRFGYDSLQQQVREMEQLRGFVVGLIHTAEGEMDEDDECPVCGERGCEQHVEQRRDHGEVE